MIAKIRSYALNGLSGIPVVVEVDSSNGLPAFDVVGLADTAVKESRDRVRAAVKNSGRAVPARKITANFAPANVKKEGSVFDLPLALLVDGAAYRRRRRGCVFGRAVARRRVTQNQRRVAHSYFRKGKGLYQIYYPLRQPCGSVVRCGDGGLRGEKLKRGYRSFIGACSA